MGGRHGGKSSGISRFHTNRLVEGASVRLSSRRLLRHPTPTALLEIGGHHGEPHYLTKLRELIPEQ